jgi:SAM-dependent methyltransferase
MLNKITAYIHQHINWIGVDFIDPSAAFEKTSPTEPARNIRVLDYACGPGTITHALGARATEYIGIDLSENMAEAYNLRFGANSSAPSTSTDEISNNQDETLNAHAVVGNLLDAKEPSPDGLASPEYFNFDLVVVGLGFHHFPDIALATSRLVERLKPGGVFLILDFVTHAMDEQPSSGQQPAKHTVAHLGFSEEELKAYFEGAGLTDFQIVRMDEEVLLRGESRRRLFLAKGRKA